MKKMASIYLRFLWAVSLLMIASCTTPVQNEDDFVPGELLVQMAPGVTPSEADGIITGFGLEVLEYFRNVGIAWIRVPAGEEREWKEILPDDDRIISASLVYGRVTLR
jgi:hypothetical protein